jgi:hypothetical protein
MVVICIDLRQIFHAPVSTDFNFFRVLCVLWTELVEPKCTEGVNGNASSSSIFNIKFLATAAAAAVSSCSCYWQEIISP